MNFAALTLGLFERRNWATVAAVPLLAAAVWMPGLTLQRSVFSYIVTFDITQSMDVEDVSLGAAPISRLNFARAVMRDSLERLPCGSRATAGEPTRCGAARSRCARRARPAA